MKKGRREEEGKGNMGRREEEKKIRWEEASNKRNKEIRDKDKRRVNGKGKREMGEMEKIYRGTYKNSNNKKIYIYRQRKGEQNRS